ncbi:MAG: SDR family NAD(P)-dependent oxidoreductase [Paracoccaceae bacterium]|nr:SDR family NAD(P)-dependent oxidoreductase [Paracoccaceae bacterium]
MSKKPLSGKAAAVAGAGRGIGRAIALAFSRAGANLAICSRSIDELNEVKNSSEAHGVKCLVGVADITDPKATEAFCKAAIDEFGQMDILVNSAGVELESSKVESSDPERWWRTVEVNIRGPYLVTRFFLGGLAEGAKIINISSGLGLRAADWNSSYTVSKAGLHIFTEVLANELWPRKIDVNNLIPGPVATDMFNRGARGVRYTPEEILERFAKELPPGFSPQERIKHPDEVAELALYMATLPVGGPTGQTFSLGRRPF